jgi:hypothetical protein
MLDKIVGKTGSRFSACLGLFDAKMTALSRIKASPPIIVRETIRSRVG